VDDDESANLSHYLLPLLKTITPSKSAIVSTGKVREATNTAARKPTGIEKPTQSILRSILVSPVKDGCPQMYAGLVFEPHA